MKRFNFKNQIIFENENYLAINKPSGVSSLHERIGIANSVFEQAKIYDHNLQLCHRLDKETSGVLLLSKHTDAYVHAAKAFEKREVQKNYHAISHRVHQFKDFVVELPLITTRSGRSAVDKSKGKPSKTTFNTIEKFIHYTLISCNPHTGRQHQIRIHLASQNAPIAADEIYGGKRPFLSNYKKKFNLKQNTEEKPMIQRFALHAFALEIPDLNGNLIHINAKYPKDFQVFLSQLQKFDKLFV